MNDEFAGLVILLVGEDGYLEAGSDFQFSQSPFTFAGLWENRKDPESGEWVRTCTIITGEPNELVAQIHPRMPVILPPATSRGLVR